MENVNPRVTSLIQVMAEIAEPGKLFIANFYHDDRCPADEEGGALQDCDCMVQLRLDCYAIEPAAKEWWERAKGHG